MNFIPGMEYKRSTLHDEFGGSPQNGISTSARNPIAFIFTGASGEKYGYHDGFQGNGVFWYTGEGQVGDMVMNKGNAAIRDSENDGRELYLFEQSRKSFVTYIGRVSYLGHHESIGPDREGKNRKVIVFELEVDSGDSSGVAVDSIARGKEDSRRGSETEDLWNIPLETVKLLAESAKSEEKSPAKRSALVHVRSEAVRIYVLRRSQGICEGCGNAAPFETKADRPYLESHHIRRRADGGPDHPRWVIALCPNCHQRAHHSKDAAQFNEKLGEIVGELEK